MTMRRAVLHIDTERTWRGGENQVGMLLTHPASRDWEWHLAAPPDSEIARRLAPHAHVVHARMRGARMLSAARVIARYVRAHDIPVIDCQSSRAHGLALLVRLLVPRARIVVHRRVDYPPSPTFFSRRKYLSARVDRYVCISDAIAHVLETYGVERSRIATVHSAVNPAPFTGLDRSALRARFLREWELADDTVIIGNVAYITVQKGHDTLVRSLAELRKTGANFFCYVAGSGALEDDVRREAAALGLSDRELRFLGVRADVPDLLGATDIFFLPSNDEGLGTSLLDAAYAGCALVASNVGGIPEVVIDGRTGLLAARRDPAGFARQLARCVEDRALRDALVKAARAHADAHFSWDAMVRGNLRVYEDLLSR